MPDTPGDLAEKLDTLFETVTKPDGSRYTQEEVIRGTGGCPYACLSMEVADRPSQEPQFQHNEGDRQLLRG